jgi:hypothetical protein
MLTEESGIQLDVVTGRGYYSPTATMIAQMTQLEILDPLVQKADSWLAIPIIRPDGAYHGEIIRRFPSPPKMKYVWPTGARNAVDIHPEARVQLLDRSVPLILTEGIKKADAMFSASIIEGIECVPLAINGCWGWRVQVDGGSIACPDFQDIPLNDRKIYLVVDSDYRTNDDVRRGWDALAQYLESKTGAHRIFLCVVPPLGLDKQGVDDFLAQGGALSALLGMATTPRQALLDQTPERRPLLIKSGLRVISEATDQIPHLINPLLPERAILVMAGHSGTFKTWHALGLSLDGAFGFAWLAHPELTTRAEPFRTLYVNKEMGGLLLANRLKKLATATRYHDAPNYEQILEERVHTTDEASLDLALPAQRDRLEDALLDRKIEHVVLDSLSMCWSGNEDSNSEVGAFYAQLRGITERTGASWTIIHHLLKPNTGRTRIPAKFSVRGAGQIIQQADTAIILSPFAEDSGDPDTREVSIEFVKTRTDREPPAFVSAFASHDGIYVDVTYQSKLVDATASAYAASKGDPKKADEWIVATLAAMPAMQPSSSGMRKNQLMPLLVASWSVAGESVPSERTLERRLDEMVESGELEILDVHRRYGTLYRFRSDDPELSQGRSRPATPPAARNPDPLPADQSDHAGETDHRSGASPDGL